MPLAAEALLSLPDVVDVHGTDDYQQISDYSEIFQVVVQLALALQLLMPFPVDTVL